MPLHFNHFIHALLLWRYRRSSVNWNNFKKFIYFSNSIKYINILYKTHFNDESVIMQVSKIKTKKFCLSENFIKNDYQKDYTSFPSSKLSYKMHQRLIFFKLEEMGIIEKYYWSINKINAISTEWRLQLCFSLWCKTRKEKLNWKAHLIYWCIPHRVT